MPFHPEVGGSGGKRVRLTTNDQFHSVELWKNDRDRSAVLWFHRPQHFQPLPWVLSLQFSGCNGCRFPDFLILRAITRTGTGYRQASNCQIRTAPHPGVNRCAGLCVLVFGAFFIAAVLPASQGPKDPPTVRANKRNPDSDIGVCGYFRQLLGRTRARFPPDPRDTRTDALSFENPGLFPSQ